MPNTPLTWRNQQIVNITTTGSQNDPDIIQLANGNIVVSWTTSDAGGLGSPNGSETFAQIYDPLGNRVGGEIRLNNASTDGDEQNADMTALPGGGFIVVYHDLDNPTSGGGSNIRIEEYDANGAQVSENALVVDDSGAGGDPNYRNPVVAASSDTSVIIIYEEVTGGSADLVGRIYNPATNTYGAQFAILTDSTSMGDADVAVLTNGNYVVTGNRSFTDNAVEYRIFTSTGANVLNATLVTGTSTNAENDRQASVTALTGGGFVIAWVNTDPTDTDIEFRVYNAAGTQTGAGFAGSDGPSDNNNEPKVIALADGTFVIAWDDDDGTLGVDVQHFSAVGAALGAVFTVSADSAGNISGVAMADGRFALVWDVSGGEIAMEILDTRDAVNNLGVYSSRQWQVGTVGDDVFTVAGNADVVHGWNGNDVITETNLSGTNDYFGDDGNDTLIVTSLINSDSHDGGEGNDTINWSASGEIGASYDLLAGIATDSTQDSDTMLNFENLIGTGNRDIIIGTDGVNYLDGGAGNDDINGGGGADALVGGAGNDTVHGDGDADTLLLDDYTNPSATNGNDTGHGDAGADLLWGYGGDDILFGGEEADALVGNDYASNVGGNDGLYGGAGADTLFVGLGGNAYMDGGTGADIFYGGLLNDFMRGGAGNDYLYGNLGGDDFLFLQEDFVNGDTDIVYFIDAADRLQFSASLNGDLTFTNTVLQYDANPLHTVASVYITIALGGGQTAAIAVYGATEASLAAQVEYTL